MVQRAVLAVPGLIEQQSRIENERSTRRKRLLELGGEGDHLFPHVDGSGIGREPGRGAPAGGLLGMGAGAGNTTWDCVVRLGDRQTRPARPARPPAPSSPIIRSANKKDTQNNNNSNDLRN